MSVAPAIEVQKLFKTYRDGLLGRHSFEGAQGDFSAGPSGRDFWSARPQRRRQDDLVKLLLGIVRKTGGDATLLGLPAGDRRGRREIGYLPENLRLAPPSHRQLGDDSLWPTERSVA